MQVFNVIYLSSHGSFFIVLIIYEAKDCQSFMCANFQGLIHSTFFSYLLRSRFFLHFAKMTFASFALLTFARGVTTRKNIMNQQGEVHLNTDRLRVSSPFEVITDIDNISHNKQRIFQK